MALSNYMAATAGTVTAPFFLIQGSATKVVNVKRIILQGPTLTLVEYITPVLTKYSSAPSGGTATALTAVPTDSANPASTANLLTVYTAAPTPGTAVGTLGARKLLAQATTAAAAGMVNDTIDFVFTTPITLLGIAEGLGVRLSNAPVSAVTMSVFVEWTEE